MEVSLKIFEGKEKFILVFEFEENIDDIDFDLNPINSLIYIYISEVSNRSYDVISNEIKDN